MLLATKYFQSDFLVNHLYLVNVFLVEFAIFQSGLFQVFTVGHISQEEYGGDSVRSQLSRQHLLAVSLEADNLKFPQSMKNITATFPQLSADGAT